MKGFFIFLAICLTQMATAQHTGNTAFQKLGIADGLRSNSVTSLLADSRGYLWIGTYQGLNRYDGYQVKSRFPESDIVDHLNSILVSFSDYAEERGIRLFFEHGIDSFVMDYDREKMNKVVYNLFSNALKFTPSGGSVTLSFRVGENKVVIDVADGAAPACEKGRSLILPWTARTTDSRRPCTYGMFFAMDLLPLPHEREYRIAEIHHACKFFAATQNIRFVETAVVGKMDAKLVDASNEGIICVRGVNLDKKLKKAIFHFTGSGSIEMRIGNIDGACLVEARSSSNVKFNRKVLKDISNPVDIFFRLKSDDVSLQFKDWSLSK